MYGYREAYPLDYGYMIGQPELWWNGPRMEEGDVEEIDEPDEDNDQGLGGLAD